MKKGERDKEKMERERGWHREREMGREREKEKYVCKCMQGLAGYLTTVLVVHSQLCGIVTTVYMYNVQYLFVQLVI